MKQLLRFLVFMMFSLVSLASRDQYCCSPDDRALFRNNQNFIDVWRSCSIENWGVGRMTTSCIVRTFSSLTSSCSLCFGAFTSCATHHCESRCFIDATSEACNKCALEHCGGAWTECSGTSLDSITE